jgi:hypothetical protein
MSLRATRSVLALATIGIVGLVGVAPASAHRFIVEKKEVAGTEVFKVEGKMGVENSSGEVEPDTAAIEIESEIPGARVTIICDGGSLKDEIEKEGLSKNGEVTLEACVPFEAKEGKGTELSECTVANVTIKMSDAIITGAGAEAELELRPSSGKLFGEVEINGASCSIKGKFKLESATEGKGEICALVRGEEEAVHKYVVCYPTGSTELRLGGEKAGLFGAMTMKIEKSKQWYME